ncbi:MAG: class I SAM-dependent methyltransferase, partial [Nitrosopumilus sp.]
MGVTHFSSHRQYASLEKLVAVAKTELENAKKGGDVSSFLDLIRTARQPQNAWLIDYITPRPELKEINHLIQEAESAFYQEDTSIEMLPQFRADVMQHVAFNTVRAHVKSEQGDIEKAILILDQTKNKYYGELSLIRKSNFLMHHCLAHLCIKDFSTSYESFENHWLLLKYAEPQDRVNSGIWDNQIILQMIYWFFIRHSEDFKDFFTVKNQTNPSSIWKHKKIPMLNFITYDFSWVVSFCGKPFYDHARTLIKTLPYYEIKSTTHINHHPYFDVSSPDIFTTSLFGWENYYYKQFNMLMGDPDLTHKDHNKASNLLHSFYSFQIAECIIQENQQDIFAVLRDHLPESDYKTVLEIGCTCYPMQLTNVDLTYVDISTHVCNLLKEKGIDCECNCGAAYLATTVNSWDLCIATDVLQCLHPSRLDMFVQNCHIKCRHLLARIDLNHHVRNEICDPKSPVQEVDLHPSAMKTSEWINLLSQYFEVSHHVKDH